MPHLELPSLWRQYSRRNWLWRIAATPLSAIALRDARADTSAKPLIAATAKERFIATAFEMKSRATAEGDQPFGAVVVKDGKIVAAAPSRLATRSDPTAHAEMEALRDAAKQLPPGISAAASSTRPPAPAQCAKLPLTGPASSASITIRPSWMAVRRCFGAVDLLEEPTAPHGDDEVLICYATPRPHAEVERCGGDYGVVLDL